MKKIVLLLTLLLINLNALTLKLNSTKENKRYYYILHIINNTPFECKKKILDITRYEYNCNIKGKSEVEISPKKTKFVDIYVTADKNSTLITLKPRYKTKVYRLNKPLYRKKTVKAKNTKKAKHWIFIFYKDRIFLRENSMEKGINFPVDFLKEPTPTIGALDLSGTPISYLNDSKDINDYISIKNDYDRKRYDFVILETKKALKNYPNSIFVNDFILYHIRALNKLLKTKDTNPNAQDLSYDEIIKLGKKWIKQFPSNQNIPEVLYYIAEAYQSLGQESDAKYFFDILITEHPKNRWTKLGIVSFADSLYAKNRKQKALQLYKDILYSTKDIYVASIAAKRLADIYIKTKKYKKAREYYDKIIKANPDFVLNNHQKAYDLAITLGANKIYDISIEILEKLLKKIRREPDLKELIIKSLGDMYAKEKNYKKASYYYKKYLSLYKYGNYTDEVKKSLDGLFFDTGETNSTKLLKYYNKLIDTYKTGKIYEKAAILKAKVLIKGKRYKEALDELNRLEVNFKNKKIVSKLKKEVARYLSISALNQEECLQAVKYIKEYNLTITTNQKKLVTCYLQTYNYKQALLLSQKELMQKNLKISDRLFWLDKQAVALLKARSFDKLYSLSKDMIALSSSFDKKTYLQKGLYYRFFALYGLKNYDKALQSATELEKSFKNSFDNIEVYKKITDLAKQRADDLIMIKYADKIIKLQNRFKSYPFSPQIEFEYIASLKRLNKNSKAVMVLKDLLKRVQDLTVKSRIYYEIGALSLKLNDKKAAKEAFENCIKAKKQNSWKELCKENLTLLP
jgi:tetratricopeptide (TPR) repeat protein